jgi:hypothetical protein
MQDGEKDGCWFMTMGHDMIWKRELSDLSWMGEQRRERERDNIIFSGRSGGDRELHILYMYTGSLRYG